MTIESALPPEKSTKGDHEPEFPMSQLLPVNKLCVKPEVCDAIKHSGLFIADEFITATLDAYKKGSNVVVQCGADKEAYRALAACVLDRVEKTEPTLQVLVVSPFRDDVVKIFNVLGKLNEKTAVNIHMSVAGTSFNADRDELSKRMPQVLVGTSGRILDLHFKKVIDVSRVKMLVLDNGEMMLSGSRAQKNSILSIVPAHLQFLFFVRDVSEAVEKFVQDPASKRFRHLFTTQPQFTITQRTDAVTSRAKMQRVDEGGARSSATGPSNEQPSTGTVSNEQPSTGVASKEQPSTGAASKSQAQHRFYYVYTRDEGKKLSELLKLLERTDDGKTVVGCKNPDSSDLVSLALNKACLLHVHLQKKACADLPRSHYVKKFAAADKGILLTSRDSLSAFSAYKHASTIILYDAPASRDFVRRHLSDDVSAKVIFFVDDADMDRLLSKHYRAPGFSKLSADRSKTY